MDDFKKNPYLEFLEEGDWDGLVDAIRSRTTCVINDLYAKIQKAINSSDGVERENLEKLLKSLLEIEYRRTDTQH